jgi:hypothetical protein
VGADLKEKTMKFHELVQEAHTTARNKGWHDGAPLFGAAHTYRCAALIALIHTEVDEAEEALLTCMEAEPLSEVIRGGSCPEAAEELADILIRLADLYGYARWDAGDFDIFDTQWSQSWLPGVVARKVETVPDLGEVVTETLNLGAASDPLTCLANDVSSACLTLHSLLAAMTQELRVTDPGPPTAIVAFIERIAVLRNLSLEVAIRKKLEANKARPYRHGGKRL